MSISWTRSGNDFPGSSTPITEYAIFRKIDYDLNVSSELMQEGKDHFSAKEPNKDRQLPLAYPPGDWHFIMTVPAYCEDHYATVVPTLADSTIAEGMYYTTFFIRAATSTTSVYFDSPPDSGYSLDNLSPNVPEGFAVAYNTGAGNELSWEPSDAEDFQYFKIHRGSSPDFTPAPGNLEHMTIGTGWLDTVSEGWRYYYKITAVDFSGNESDPASPGTTTAIKDPVIPKAFMLHHNVPNPFNPMTSIRYDVRASGGRVTLKVFDASGRLVRTLVNDVESPGQNTAIWYGRNDNGQNVASGVYFYRMTAPDFEKTYKMVLLR
ncbi:MAG: T9SS type A sorting domain-containing protein [Candidatus Latescibacteria bacterium]|nr:T9SS type A sorting domain-containing protein [Candidatus Latescibacterota bacterium]